MALSKIQAESMNLADTYAFTGSVSGAGDNAGMKLLATGASLTATANLDIQNVFSTNYKAYKIYARFRPLTDGADLRGKWLNGSTATTSSEYRWSIDFNYRGSSASGDGEVGGFGTDYMRFNRFGISGSDNFGIFLDLTAWNPMALSTTYGSKDGFLTGHTYSYANSNYVEACRIINNWQLDEDNDGVRFFFTTGDVREHWYAIYGVNLA